MCQNKIIDYNIQVKSKYSELYILKKDYFLRISITFKEIIKKFLHDSLVNYLCFLEEKQILENKIQTKYNLKQT